MSEWQFIKSYDELEHKPKFSVFLFKATKPDRTNGIFLNACVDLSRNMGSRVCTHWMPLPEPPTK